VKITKRKAKLEWEWKQPCLELRRLEHEHDPTLKSLFKQRAGGESTNAELKNSMGQDESDDAVSRRQSLWFSLQLPP